MTDRARRIVLIPGLLAPLAAVPLLALALMEYGPERSVLFAIYLLVWALVFLVAGVAVAIRRPTASPSEVLFRAGAWAMTLVSAAIVAMFALSYTVGL